MPRSKKSFRQTVKTNNAKTDLSSTAFLFIFIPIALFLIAGSTILYSVEKNALHKIIKSQESTSLAKQEDLITSDFQAITSDLLYIANQAGINSKLIDQQLVCQPGWPPNF